MNDELEVVLGFDMETDIGSWTPFYEGLVHGTPVMLEVLRGHEATSTCYFTGDAARRHPEVVRSVLEAGHEVGAHSLFHETVGEPIFDIPGVTPLLPEEVEHRLELNTRWVEEASGVRPVSFRAPRLFGSTAVVNALEALGYETDATYPMYFFRERLRPYHPSRDDWTREGDSTIVELPNFANLSKVSADPHGRDLDQWPLFRTESAAALLEHIDGFCGYCRERGVRPFLCFYFHPWEFHPMPAGDIHFGEGSVRPDPFIIKNCGPYAAEQLDMLLGKLVERGAVFRRAKDLGE